MPEWNSRKFAALPRWVRRVWRKHWFYLSCQFAAIGSWIFWIPYHNLPLPGYAIAVVGGIAALMSVHPDLRAWQKFVYLLLIAGFLVTEFRAIRKDHDESDAKQALFFQQQKTGFQEVATQAGQNFAATTAGLTTAINGLNDVLNTTESVAQLSKESLEEISGSGAHPCIVPQPALNGSPIPLVIWNRGKHVLTGVEIRLLSSQEFLDGHSALYKPSVNIGTLRNEWPKPIPEAILPIPDEKGISNYEAEIWTQNGFYTEVMNFTRGRHKQWSYEYWLTNQTIAWRDGKRVGMMGSIAPDCKMDGWSDDLIDKQNSKPQNK